MAKAKTARKATMRREAKVRAVLVTTEHRGVFFGYSVATTPTGKDKAIALTKVRNCLYWDTGVHGFLGLATTGPNSKCRVGPAAPSTTLTGVTSITLVTDEAAAAWEKSPWS